MKKTILLFSCILVLFVAVVVGLDRHFFKSNKSFSIQMILSTLPPQPQWEMPPPTPTEKEQLLEICAQSFHYLNRGGQSAVFMSDDGKHVLKFYRFPSHLRPLGWLKHPISYRFSKKRAAIKKHNFEKLDITFGSFLLAYSELKKESGLRFVHLNPTDNLQLSVVLVDRLGNNYLVDLDRVAFVLQERADGIFPTLEQLIYKDNIEKAKNHIDSLVELIIKRCELGITDNDAILDQNYGFAKGRAIHVDIGRLAHDPTIQQPKKKRAHLLKTIKTLREWLRDQSPELADHLERKLSSKA